MALSIEAKLHALRIIKDEGQKNCVTPERLIEGKSDAVLTENGDGAVFASGQDKVKGTKDEIYDFWGFLSTHTPPYIRPVPQNNPACYEFTSAGKKYYEQLESQGVEPLDVPLDSVIFNEKLLAKVTPAFESGNYDTAIRDACVLLEEAIRDKAGLEETVSGQKLVVDALHHDKGVLTFPECKKAGEAEGVFFLYSGVMGFARNISAHHTNRLNGQLTALQIVIHIDFLLRLFDTAQSR